MSSKSTWIYFDENTEEWSKERVPVDELFELRARGVITDETQVANVQAARRTNRLNPLPFARVIRPRVTMLPSAAELWAERTGQGATVLCGPNNSGKSFILKQLWLEAESDSYLMGVNRFSTVGVINTRLVDPLEYRQYQTNFLTNYFTQEQNTEESGRNLEQTLTGLDDDTLMSLFKACEDLLGNKFSIRQINPLNRFSPLYIDMDGEKLAVGSRIGTKSKSADGRSAIAARSRRASHAASAPSTGVCGDALSLVFRSRSGRQ